MRQSTCVECSKEFNVKSDTGRVPSKCPACKGESAPRAPRAKTRTGGGSKALARAPERALVVEEARVSAGYRVRFRMVEIECGSLRDLLPLLDHISGEAG